MKKALRQHLSDLSSEEHKVIEQMTHRSKDLCNETFIQGDMEYFHKNGEYLNYYNAYKGLRGESENYEVCLLR
ncbi:MAG: hypothetical protein BTN85_1812 [Candidatus Methanohalarchaeum thermophilum]|uniref:Uncharacterized protein n=1 Tax=Methanohalarchaeum thermophilum TaxID=1903181 RepID=A0A1Q6DS13_METT1|nr:MAG: hypothetical protein BTN85_1812 [Candidatus Methanohalarchaeum thermophilum]